MNLITAILLGLWVSGWTLAAARELLQARAVRVNDIITSGEEQS